MGFLDGVMRGEKQRDENKALRAHFARRLEEGCRRLEKLAAQAGRRATLSGPAPEVELNRRRDQLARVASELEHASYGYWGHRHGDGKQEKRRDDDRHLALLCEFDESLDPDVAGLERALEPLGPLAGGEPGPLLAALSGLDAALEQLEKRLRQREELLRNPERVDWPDHRPAPSAAVPVAPTAVAPAATTTQDPDRKE